MNNEIEKMAMVVCSNCVVSKRCRFYKKPCSAIKAECEVLYNAGYRKQEWISVEDDLPKGKVNCLVHYQHTYCDDDGYWSIGISFYDGHKFSIGLEYKVTHWMPLPEAPKMKGGEE
jgi:hypothetical protein